MEVYAGFSENADHNVGRVIDAIDELGELDNTVIIWIWGDNGASMEGTVTGSFNELTMQNGIPLTDEMQLQLVRALRRHRRSGAPRSWTRTTARRGRGRATPRSSGASRSARTSAAPATRWSCTGRTRITDAGGLRSQFTHVIDVAPDDPRPRRHPAAATPSTGSSRSRCTARRSPPSLDRRGRAGAPHAAVLRDHRQPGHVQGRLVARDEDRAHPVGAHARRAQAVRARRLGSGRRPGRALLPARRLHPGPRPGRGAPGQGRRSSRTCSGRRPSGTRCCRCSPRCPPSSACCRRSRRRRRSSSAATCRTCCRA